MFAEEQKKNWDFLRLILHNAEVYNEKKNISSNSKKKEFLIIFHGRYNEKKRLVALKRAQAHKGARASPELLYHLIFLLLLLCPMPFLSLCTSTYASHTDFYMYPFCLYYFFFAFPVAISYFVCIRLFRSSFYSMHFLFRIVIIIIIMFFVCTPKCGEHHLHSNVENK